MGKPRMIIVIRHAQSEGNQNRDIHQKTPDHRIQLTELGWQQAEEAGRKLRSMLNPDDTLQFFTSPYRRTRETTEGILKSLTSDECDPSPFPRHTIKVFEEPRLREQDFGNFQPDSSEMTRMWRERAEYGHFFYRIPNGESAADAYDRVSGFNESLWRQFGERDFPSVCILVTHGLMTRVFLMKWYHWSVEYFEDLRNVNHCEFVVMKQNLENGKFVLQNKMRTWTELMRERRAAEEDTTKHASAVPPRKRWTERQDTKGDFPDLCVPRSEMGDHAIAGSPYAPGNKEAGNELPQYERGKRGVPNVTFGQSSTHFSSSHGGRDGGGSRSGINTPPDGLPEESRDIFSDESLKAMSRHTEGTQRAPGRRTSRADALGDLRDQENSDLDSVGEAKQDEEEKSVHANVF